MSHEIRTPLNAIIGFVDILAEEETDKKKIDYLNIVQSSGNLLLNLINDILDFSKIESNKLDINKEVFQISDLYELMISYYTPSLNQKSLEFKTNLDKDLPIYLKSDFLRIKQILTNLLSNAIKFTPKDGKITFEIKYSEDRESIEFSVDDTGIGIAPENHKKVFELFSQAETTTTKKFGGTGLGLSISAKLVELLDGEIGIQSQIGEGSRFYFTIPIVDYDKNMISCLKTKEENGDVPKKLNLHVLVAEDNKANQKFMSIILKKLGLTFDIVSDGFEAMESFKVSKYDAILMDENMPNMSGIETTKKILEYEKENNLKHTIIVALTANALKGDRERFIEAGMDEYLTKPLNKHKLIDILSRLSSL
jgi:two-component system, sensor histidine kinase